MCFLICSNSLGKKHIFVGVMVKDAHTFGFVNSHRYFSIFQFQDVNVRRLHYIYLTIFCNVSQKPALACTAFEGKLIAYFKLTDSFTPSELLSAGRR